MKKFNLHTAFNLILKKIRGYEFGIDQNISSGYLLWYSFGLFFKLMKGFLYFRKFRFIFLSRGVNFEYKAKIYFRGVAKFSDYVYINALSKNGVLLGKNFSIGRYSSIECTGSIRSLGEGFKCADNVGLGSFNFLGCAGGIFIGADTITGNFVSMHSENHNFTDLGTPIRLQGVTRKGIFIGKNCWIGAKVTILDGVHLEDGVIIAAGSVVTAGIYKKNSIFAGVPARLIRSY